MSLQIRMHFAKYRENDRKGPHDNREKEWAKSVLSLLEDQEQAKSNMNQIFHE